MTTANSRSSGRSHGLGRRSRCGSMNQLSFSEEQPCVIAGMREGRWRPWFVTHAASLCEMLKSRADL